MGKKIIIYFMHFLLFTSCVSDSSISNEWILLNSKRTCDSIGINNTIVCFEEETGFSVIFYTNKNPHSIKKLYLLPGYPPFIDSLVITQKNVFTSTRLNTSYYIKDSTVLCIQYVPIFHPNSTLKGQTPWKQAYVSTHIRLN